MITFIYFYGKKRRGKAYVPRHGVYHLQYSYNYLGE
jgi:hypothetical protein